MLMYRKATLEDLEQIWDYNIASNPDEDSWIRWKTQFIRDNQRGAAVTFVVVNKEEPVGEGTLLLSTDCRAIRGRTVLCDGHTIANINALRIRKEYEGQGHVSSLMKIIEQYAKSIGINQLTIGVEASETRNLSIYLHLGYDEFIMLEAEEDVPVLYYGKQL